LLVKTDNKYINQKEKKGEKKNTKALPVNKLNGDLFLYKNFSFDLLQAE
jgi:hypothetical protein